MKKTLILLVVTLALTASAQESNVINKIKNRVASTPPPPPEPVIRPPQTNTPVVLPPKTNQSTMVVVSRNPITLVLQRPFTVREINRLIAKHPNEQRYKDERADLLKKFEAAIAEGMQNLTNDQLRRSYFGAVAFWTTNYCSSNGLGKVVPGTPPEDQRYFSPEVSLTNAVPSQ